MLSRMLMGARPASMLLRNMRLQTVRPAVRLFSTDLTAPLRGKEEGVEAGAPKRGMATAVTTTGGDKDTALEVSGDTGGMRSSARWWLERRGTRGVRGRKGKG